MLTFDFNPFPELHSGRLRLRAIQEEDAAAHFAVRSDSRVNEFLDAQIYTEISQSEDIIKKIKNGIEENTAIAWAICLQEDPTLIGLIGFWRTIPEHHRAEIGYSLHPDHWNKGIMYEALRLILDYCFGTMKIHSVEANVNPNNIASKKVLEKHGFQLEAHFKENYYFHGKFLDSYIYSLLEKNRTKDK